MEKCRFWLFSVGGLSMLLPLLLPALVTAWVALRPSPDASYFVVVHLGPLWLLAGLGLVCVLYAAFAGKKTKR